MAVLIGGGLAALSYALLTRKAPLSISPYFIENALPLGGGTLTSDLRSFFSREDGSAKVMVYAGAGDVAILSPAARKLAEENGIDPNSIAGTGKGGRVTKEDVVAAVEAKKNAPVTPAAKPAAAPIAAATAEAPRVVFVYVGDGGAASLRQAVSSGQTCHFESFYAPLGSWFELHVYPSEEGLAVYFQDISARKGAEEAARQALSAAGIAAQDIDLIIVATSTPDMVFPSVATMVQHKLGTAGCPAFDVQAVCSGFIYALTIADSMIQSGTAKRALVIGSEIFSRILDFKDRTTCVLFGDGAGAVVLEASDQPGILATDLHADGKYKDILCVPGHVNRGAILGDPVLKMDGQAVFKLAVGVLEDTARASLAKANLTDADIDWLIPHQANIRIMQSTAKKLKLGADKVVVTVDQHGNTSAASIPLALDHAVRSGQVQRGQTLLLEGVGGGFTWGAVLVDY